MGGGGDFASTQSPRTKHALLLRRQLLPLTRGQKCVSIFIVCNGRKVRIVADVVGAVAVQSIANLCRRRPTQVTREESTRPGAEVAGRFVGLGSHALGRSLLSEVRGAQRLHPGPTKTIYYLSTLAPARTNPPRQAPAPRRRLPTEDRRGTSRRPPQEAFAEAQPRAWPARRRVARVPRPAE